MTAPAQLLKLRVFRKRRRCSFRTARLFPWFNDPTVAGVCVGRTKVTPSKNLRHINDDDRMASPTAFPRPRHQSSLKEIIFPSEASLEPGQRDQAKRKFYHIVNYWEAIESRGDRTGGDYNRPLLVRLTYEYSRSEQSRDIFLQTFFQSIGL